MLKKKCMQTTGFCLVFADEETRDATIQLVHGSICTSVFHHGVRFGFDSLAHQCFLQQINNKNLCKSLHTGKSVDYVCFTFILSGIFPIFTQNRMDWHLLSAINTCNVSFILDTRGRSHA